MTRDRSSSRMPLFWQIMTSVLVGVALSFVLFAFEHYKSAEARLNSVASDTNLTQSFSLNALDLIPALDRPMTLLVLGVDSNGPNTQRFTGTRSDVMILVSLDPQTSKVGMLSIPRDTRVALPGLRGINKINAAHALGGPQLAVRAVQDALGIQVDHYVAIDTLGLRDLFQQLGPVQVLVEKPMHYTDHSAHLTVDLEPGAHILDPLQTEEYVRFRHDAAGDIGRVERQQWFLRQVAQQLREPQILLKLPHLVQFANEYVATDLQLDDMMKLVRFFKDFNVSHLEMATIPGMPAYIDGISYWIADPESSRATVNRLFSNSSTNLVASSGPTWSNQSSPSSTHLKIIIKYPRGFETLAAFLESKLTDAGYRVTYKCPAEVVDCQHEQLIQKSSRVDDSATSCLLRSVNGLANFPVTIAIDARPACDFMLVISPVTSLNGNANTVAAGSSSSFTKYKD